MEKDEVIEKLYARMKNLYPEVWFTSKTDPTYKEPGSYYELDEYGYLTENARNKVAKEVLDYIGDGAIDIEGAMGLWLDEKLSDCKIAFLDNIITPYKPVPVVDNIKAYEVKLEATKVDGMLTPIPDELLQASEVTEWTDEDKDKYFKEYQKSLTDIYHGDSKNKIEYLKNVAKHYNFNDLEFSEETYKEDIDKLATEYVIRKEKQYKSNSKLESKKQESYDHDELQDWIMQAYDYYHMGNDHSETWDYVFEATGDEDLANDVMGYLEDNNYEIDNDYEDEDDEDYLNEDVQLQPGEKVDKDGYVYDLAPGNVDYVSDDAIYRKSPKGNIYQFRRYDIFNADGDFEDEEFIMTNITTGKSYSTLSEIEFNKHLNRTDWEDVDEKGNKLTESKNELEESEFKDEDLLNDFSQYAANNYKELPDGTYQVDVPAEAGFDKVLTIPMLKKAYMKVKKLMNLDNGTTRIVYESKQIKKVVTENARHRLQEENVKSAAVISDMFTDPDFDSESPEGQIIMRTSELFNTLSAKGYDVQVSFDNGQSQSVIFLGNQGGQINITITNNNQPLRAFSSGNFELLDDNIKILNDVKEQIEVI